MTDASGQPISGPTRRGVLAGASAVLGAALARPAQAEDKSLTIWWTKGFYESEDIAIRKIVDKFQAATGFSVNLSLFSIEDANTKAISAVAAGSPPDVGFGASYDFSARGKWAFDGKLDDVSDVIDAVKSDLIAVSEQSVLLQNGKTGKRGYYAIPIAIANQYIFYWRSMLADAGFKPEDVPQAWGSYWGFWCDKVQPALRAKGQRVYGIGSPTSAAAGDTTVQFLAFLSAHGQQVADAGGKFLLDTPDGRRNTIAAMNDYVGLYKSGCTPASSIAWTDVDNNVNLYNKTTVMTPNSSLSIPGKYLDEKNDEAYYHDLVTTGLPLGPDGKDVPQVTTVKAAVVFADAKNRAGAHRFMKFFMQPDNYGPYVEGALGRWVPVTRSELGSPFWSDGKDPHRSVAAKIALGPNLPFPMVADYRYTAVNAENVWGKAMSRIIKDNLTTEQAVDEMNARIRELLR